MTGGHRGHSDRGGKVAGDQWGNSREVVKSRANAAGFLR